MIDCDKCGEIFKLKTKTQRLDRDIERVYVVCPRCKDEYTAYLTNDKIKELQGQVQMLILRNSRENKIKQIQDKIAREKNLLRLMYNYTV